MAWLARLCWFLTVPFVRYEARGDPPLEDYTHGIVVVNHHSMFDWFGGLVLIHRFRRYPRLLISGKYVNRRFSGWALRAAGTIPVGEGEDRAKALQNAEDALRRRVPILVMPEGKLHWDPTRPTSTGPARTGVARLASVTEVPIMTVGLAGTEDVWPPDRYLPRLNPFRRKTVVAAVAEVPLYVHGDDHRGNTELIMKEIGVRLEEAYEARAERSSRRGRRRPRELEEGVRDRPERGH